MSGSQKTFCPARVKSPVDFTPEDITFFTLHSRALKFLHFHIKFHYLQGKFKKLHVSQKFQMKSLLVKLPLTVEIPLNYLVIGQIPMLLWHGTFVCFNLCKINFYLKQYKAIPIIYLHYS